MNIKEQENQLEFSLNMEIFFTIIIWFVFWGFIGFRLYRLRSITEVPITIGINVPTVKLSNLDILRASIKSVSTSNLPVVRIEPFD